MPSRTEDVCEHCGKQITHYSGTLWHQVGAQVFPQYCAYIKNWDGESIRHTPARLDEFGFGLVAANPGNEYRLRSEGERLAHLQYELSSRSPKAPDTVPAGWLRWLATQYSVLPGALVPCGDGKTLSATFEEADDTMKLTMIYEGAMSAKSSDWPVPTLPKTWGKWFYEEYRKKLNSPKADFILQRAQNGETLSSLESEIVSLAVNGGLSEKGHDMFADIYAKVLAGAQSH